MKGRKPARHALARKAKNGRRTATTDKGERRSGRCLGNRTKKRCCLRGSRYNERRGRQYSERHRAPPRPGDLLGTNETLLVAEMTAARLFGRRRRRGRSNFTLSAYFELSRGRRMTARMQFADSTRFGNFKSRGLCARCRRDVTRTRKGGEGRGCHAKQSKQCHHRPKPQRAKSVHQQKGARKSTRGGLLMPEAAPRSSTHYTLPRYNAFRSNSQNATRLEGTLGLN